ncbi:hypothetical protein [Shimazuella alba]|nr:hypothetical protein [Shimazuella alba]
MGGQNESPEEEKHSDDGHPPEESTPANLDHQILEVGLVHVTTP